MRQLVLAVVASSVASATPPKTCDVGIELASGDKDFSVKAIVTSITHVKSHYAVVLTDDAKRDHTFDLYSDGVPFKVKSALDVTVHRGGGFHVVYDGLIKDAAGKTLIVASASGSIDLADGWTVKMGAVITSRQDPNQKEMSVERTMGLDFERGKTKASVKPGTCAEIKDGDAVYWVSGTGRSWLGVRPPEGVDYQMFSIIRR